MEHIRSYTDFNVDEGLKTWIASVLAALSLAVNTPSFATPSEMSTNKMEISKDTTMSANDIKNFITKTSLNYNNFQLLNKIGTINGGALEYIVQKFIDKQIKKGVTNFKIQILSKSAADKIVGDYELKSVYPNISNFISWSEDGVNWVFITPIE